MAGLDSYPRDNGFVCSDGAYSKRPIRRSPARVQGKKATIIAIAFALTIAPALLIALEQSPEPRRTSTAAYVPHAPININSNAQLQGLAALEGWPGTGSFASPYIISGFEFSGFESATLFYVGSTTLYFNVRDCYFHDCGQAVFLDTVINAKVENCTIERSEVALIPYFSEVTIVNNTIRDNLYAGLAFFTFGNNYSNNVFQGNFNGLNILDGNEDRLALNTFQDNQYGGLILTDSTYVTLVNNAFLNDGLVIRSSELTAWTTHFIGTSNTVNGKPILYLVDDVFSNITGDYGQVILANCTTTIVMDQDLRNTTTGVLAGFCRGISVRTSYLTDNNVGMELDYCSNSSLMSTHATNNTAGIYFVSSDFCYAAGTWFTGDQTGAVVENSPDTTVMTSIFDSNEVAIDIEYSARARILMNTMTNCGIIINGDLLEYWNTHNITTDNTVNGYPVLYFKNQIGTPVPSFAGQIILANCAQMQVAGSYVDRVSAGFQLGFTSGCRITTLSAANCRWGVRLFESPGIQVDNAILENNLVGVYVDRSDMCTVTTNWIRNCTSAIVLQESSTATLTINTMVNGGIVIDSSAIEDWNTHTIDVSNFVNSKGVYYRKDSSGFTVLSGYGQVILANCANATVRAQSITNASRALQMGFCTNVTVNNLTASGNWVGLMMEESNGCTVVGPWLTYNHYGLYMEGGARNSLTDGLFYGNELYGAYLDINTAENLLTNNTFQYNNGAGDVYDPSHVQAYDAGAWNMWNTTTGGNYWQDWQSPDFDHDGIVDVAYTIDGYASSFDYLPLTKVTRVIPEFGLPSMIAAIAVTLAIVCVAGRSRRVRT